MSDQDLSIEKLPPVSNTYENIQKLGDQLRTQQLEYAARFLNNIPPIPPTLPPE